MPAIIARRDDPPQRDARRTVSARTEKLFAAIDDDALIQIKGVSIS
jgi:hypothetical protein